MSGPEPFKIGDEVVVARIANEFLELMEYYIGQIGVVREVHTCKTEYGTYEYELDFSGKFEESMFFHCELELNDLPE